ncbi:MAG: DNA modification methylase [halophilic archaeon J07HX5]|jgi:DNA modification methylase|nr:MAG: DNA modification methylase [halophilic archaeon J07HX5]
METTHRVVVGDARQLAAIEDNAVELVVTSPPYPMIELWDELFTELNPEIGRALQAGEGQAAFEAMHAELDTVWTELERVLVDGGIACINVGDATRTVDDQFRVYQNHARIVDAFEARGFDPLPEVLWRKPTNSAAKFMGSGMVPPNAYVTLEHEYVLVFRNGGGRRQFAPGADRRYAAAYFWEERNDWFSDLWTDITGQSQPLERPALRDRSGAYPFVIPYRLINMYSVYDDTVLDPFWGTGTTTMAALVAGRNSIGYEIESEFVDAFETRIADAPAVSQTVVEDRLRAHQQFVTAQRETGTEFDYNADHYEFPVRTKQEQSIRFHTVATVDQIPGGYRAVHEPVDRHDSTDGEDAVSNTADGSETEPGSPTPDD